MISSIRANESADERLQELAQLPRSIAGSIGQTFKLYAELLQAAQAREPFLVPREYAYGPGPRHKVDLYEPSSEVEPSGRRAAPVVVFVHGGGLDKGDKRLPMVKGAHQNVGTFFARHGFLTVRP
jgi:acetyl esterase/lipase